MNKSHLTLQATLTLLVFNECIVEISEAINELSRRVLTGTYFPGMSVSTPNVPKPMDYIPVSFIPFHGAHKRNMAKNEICEMWKM